MSRLSYSLIVVIVVALLFVTVGAIVFINSLSSKSSPTATPTPTITAPTPTTSPTLLPTPSIIPFPTSIIVANENLASTDVHGGSGPGGWNMTFTLQNSGANTATITNIIIDGTPYRSMNPVPVIIPAIENGYALPPTQSVTITIQVQGNNSPNPFHNGGTVYVVTAIGNSYLIYTSSGL